MTLRSNRGVGRLIILAVAMLLLATSISAQSTTQGAIGGTVRDPSGSVVPNAGVSALNVATNSKSTATTDANGRFHISGLQPSSYTLEVTVSGFNTYQQLAVIVEVGRTTTVDVNLSLATQKATVIAVSEAPVIVTTSPEFSTNINQVSMNNLPSNLRRWSYFALGTPGTNPDGTFGLVSFRGISGLLNNSTVDGGDNNQAFFAEEKGRTRISYTISVASVQEFQVNTSNYSSEYGRSAGGVVNAVTKSGTNQFHGEGFWLFRSSNWGAYNPFHTLSSLVGTPPVAVTTPIKPLDKRHQFGGAIGGPIIKDKLFFFFSGDQQKRNFPGLTNPGVPLALFGPFTAAELTTLAGRLIPITAPQRDAAIAFLVGLTGEFARRGDQLILFPKIDWMINSKNRFTASYNRMRWESPAGIQTQGVVFRGIESLGDDFVKADSVIAQWHSTLTQNVVNQFRFQYGRDFEYQIGQPSIPGEPVSSQGVSPQITLISSSNFVFGKPDFLERPAYPDEKNYQFADTLSLARGQHFFKFGFDINRVHDLLDNLRLESGAYSYSNRVNFITDYVAWTINNANPPRLCGTVLVPVPCYSNFTQNFGPTAWQFRTIDLGFFAQDDWRITRRLTLNLGLRYEYQKLPKPQVPNPSLPQTGVFPSDRNNFGPRVGAALDLTGRGKTVIRGGFGIYFGRIINSTISNAITNTGLISSTGTALAQLAYFFLPTTAGRPIYPNVGVLGTTPPDVIVFKTGLQNPLIYQYDLAIEHQIATNTAISLSFIGSLGRDLPDFIDTNLKAPTASITYTVSGGPRSGQAFTFPLYTGTRPNINFGRITAISDLVKSKYSAFVFQFNRRMTKGLQFQSFYTIAHSSDNGQSSTTFTSSNNVLNRFDLKLEQGRSNVDIRHRFGLSAIWEPEYFKNSGTATRVALDGWGLAPIISFASGAPYTGFVSGNPPSGTGATTSSINGAGGSNRPPFEVRNAYQMPRFIAIDLRVSKKFQIVERLKVEVFGDFFNLLNHKNVVSVQTSLYSTGGTAAAPTLAYTSSFGVPTASSSTLTAQRQIQIGARVSW